jgi:hypothetical protein
MVAAISHSLKGPARGARALNLAAALGVVVDDRQNHCTTAKIFQSLSLKEEKSVN